MSDYKIPDKKIRNAVRLLDQINGRDPERAHSEADDVLLGLVPPEITEAYMQVRKRCDWWPTA